jgi:hypothetical protein
MDKDVIIATHADTGAEVEIRPDVKEPFVGLGI